MTYDFTSIINRHGLDSIAVDPDEGSVYRKDIVLKEGITDHIPMWVADMNFATVPTVPQSMCERLTHPTYGYFTLRDEYYDGIIAWHEKRNAVSGITKENIGYENGVLGAFATALHCFCSQGDVLLLHAPTYIGFTHVIENNGYRAVHTDLKRDADDIWRMDYEDMEEKIVKHKIHFAVFCSPHNPTGRVWTREEIEKAMAIYKKHDVIVFSDEIWSDLTLFDNRHIPTQSVSEDARMRTIALYAPSKTFNLAGLVGSYHIIYNQYLKDRMDKEASLGHYNSPNLASMYAQIGAYKPEGYVWTDELKTVLSENVEYAYRHIKECYKGIRVSKPEGTYMLYLDCADYLRESGKTIDDLLRAGYEAGVDWQDGRPFFLEDSIRMNLALPLSRVKEAFERLDRYVFYVV